MSELGSDRVAVLLVEDDEEDYLLTKDLLAETDGAKHELDWVRDHRSALEAVAATGYDVCLVDYRLGAENGIALVRELASNEHGMPVIVLTGHGDRDVDIEATEAGATDFLVKGEFSPVLLERTIRYAVSRHADRRALREKDEELRQAQKMEAVGSLAGGIAHDFNNMMSAVIGFSMLVLARLEDVHPMRGHVEQILKAGERASGMTNQLLAFSRKQVLQPRVLDLNAVVVEIEKLLRRLIGADIELISVLEPKLAPIEADPGQLEQILMNLAVNARDAMPKGGNLTIATANVELGTEPADSQLELVPGAYVRLTVSDTGTGMDQKTMERIFEPFFTTKPEGKGTGLGLATVFGIVGQSGGTIEVESEEGQGTAFSIYLPQAQAAIEQLEHDSGETSEPRGSETILLVEDEDLVRNLERAVLEESGYTVLEARDADQALELALTYRGDIDLLLTDVVMPKLSGYELAERVAPQRPGMKILYASGYAVEAIEGVLEPSIAFLTKPLTPTSLARKVREVLDAPGAASEGTAGQEPLTAPNP